MYYIGIDLGGTNIATAVVDENFKILAKVSLPTQMPRPAEEIANDMAKSVAMACEKAGITSKDVQWVGVGCPGAVNQDSGVIEFANNLNFEKVPLVSMIEKATNCKCYIENDANSAAYGELIAGAGKGSDNFVAITLGTGLGGGIIIDGKIYSGFNWFGAELGHMGMVYEGEPCSCGRKGCFEAYASATALIRQTKKAMELNPDSKLWEAAGGDINNVNGKTAFDAMRMGDMTAKDVVDKYIDYLAYGLCTIVNVFQPKFICVGGGISYEKDTLINPLSKYIKKHSYSKNADKQTVIKAAELGNDAGIIGAAMLGKLHCG